MNLGFCQVAVQHGDRTANFQAVERLLHGRQADVMVLPELFATGYGFESRKQAWNLAESLTDSQTIRFLQALAASLDGCVTGTLPERDGEKLFNTAVLVNRKGLLGAQRKIHLTDYERQFFEPGQTVATIVLPTGGRMGMMTCFDCWFPAYSALLKQQGVQMIASSCSFGGDMTPRFMPIRAMETQTFVVCCNRVGKECVGGQVESFCGGSQILSPDGKLLARGGRDEQVAVAEIPGRTTEHPIFADRLCRNFQQEQRRYQVTLKD